MEIWLWEAEYFHGESITLLHLPGTDLWFSDDGYDEENIQQCHFTEKFWEEVNEGKRDALYRIGSL
jgi:hypothetical protein